MKALLFDLTWIVIWENDSFLGIPCSILFMWVLYEDADNAFLKAMVQLVKVFR